MIPNCDYTPTSYAGRRYGSLEGRFQVLGKPKSQVWIGPNLPVISVQAFHQFGFTSRYGFVALEM